MKDRMDESSAVGAALEVIHGEQDKEYSIKVSEDTLYSLSRLLWEEEFWERSIYTDTKYPDHIPLEDFGERLGPTLLKKLADALEFGADEAGRMNIPLCYREVNALALASLGRPLEGGMYGRKFWEAILEGRLDHHRMIEQDRSLYPHVLESVVSFVEAGGRDQYNLRGVFERLSNIGDKGRSPTRKATAD